MNTKQLTGMSLGELLTVGAVVVMILGVFLCSNHALRSQEHSTVRLRPVQQVDVRLDAFDVQVLDITLTGTHGCASTCTVVYANGTDTKRVVYVPISR